MSSPALPVGFRLEPDPTLRVARCGTVLTGGTPWMLLRLTGAGAARAAWLLAGAAVGDRAGGVLARRLVGAGLAHPRPPVRDGMAMEVVVPARDRSADLDRCLAGLGLAAAVVVVDDGSTEAAAVAAVTARHGARLVRRPAAGGPAAARNDGLAATKADLVAFVDSDADVSAETLRRLADHLSDPVVAAAAPRVRPAARGGRSSLGRFAVARSPLDAGAGPALVRPGGRVPYVPTAVLVARRAAVDEAGRFDPALRYGEDVDLGWRLTDAGWSVRFDPSLEARHREPRTWREWLRRRFRYGTSAGPLARRHGARLGGPPLVGLVAPVTVADRARRGEIPPEVAAPLAALAPARTLLGLARWGVPLWWPALLTLAGRRRGARPVVAVAVVAPPLLEWWQRRPALDPVRWTAAALADDAAYGAGVWLGCLRARTTTPLRPRLTPNLAHEVGHPTRGMSDFMRQVRKGRGAVSG